MMIYATGNGGVDSAASISGKVPAYAGALGCENTVLLLGTLSADREAAQAVANQPDFNATETCELERHLIILPAKTNM